MCVYVAVYSGDRRSHEKLRVLNTQHACTVYIHDPSKRRHLRGNQTTDFIHGYMCSGRGAQATVVRSLNLAAA